MRTLRTIATSTFVGLSLAALAAPAGAAPTASEAGGYTTNRGAVVYHATYLGKAAGLRGNVHEISLESEGDINHVHSYFCPSGQDPRYTSGCTLRDQRMILPEKSPLTFRVSSTGLSAKVVGRARATWTRTSPATSPWTSRSRGRRGPASTTASRGPTAPSPGSPATSSPGASSPSGDRGRQRVASSRWMKVSSRVLQRTFAPSTHPLTVASSGQGRGRLEGCVQPLRYAGGAPRSRRASARRRRSPPGRRGRRRRRRRARGRGCRPPR